ncbi:phospholipase D family nuclease [Piscirickettsia litoralis]|nr:phospholipase D family protein [Piscirickettsia litoralis]
MPASLSFAGILKNAPYQVCFTPGGKCTHLIVKTINTAKNSIRVQAYSFTSWPIVRALIKAQERGVKVELLLDKSNLKKRYNVIKALKSHHIKFLIDAKPAIAHNKVIIIDGDIVVTGSFNFTYSAQKRNAENVLIIKNKKLASLYIANYDKRQQASQAVAYYCGYNQCS